MGNKVRTARIVVGAAVLLLILLAPMVHLEAGTLCIFCPVGFLEVAAAAKSIPWAHAPYVLAGLALAFILGRAFCAWICPTGLLKNLFGGRKPRGVAGRTGEACSSCEGGCSGGCAKGMLGKSDLMTQGAVLGVLLLVSLVVGFPVFCLICPIGLAMGTVYAISRVFVMWTFGLELIVFPLMLLAEVFLFRRWCSKICPLGFFMGLMSALRNKVRFGVTVQSDPATCKSDSGCNACAVACGEDVAVPAMDDGDRADCTLCLHCVENCPTKSIQVKLGKF